MDNKSIEEQDIVFTQGIRRQIISTLVSDPDTEKLLNDPDRADLLTKLLKDMDQTNLGKLRIKSNDDNVDKLVANKNLITEILTTLKPSELEVSGVNRNKRSLDSNDGSRDYVEGETNVGISTQTVDDFNE